MENINEILEHIEDEDPINIKKFLFRLLSKWYWFALFGCLGLGIGLLITKRSPASYKMSASVLINSESKGLNAESFFEGLDFQSKTNVENHILMLQSYTLNHQALKNLHLEVSWYKKGLFKDDDLYAQLPYRVSLTPNATNITHAQVTIIPHDENSFTLSAEIPWVVDGSSKDITVQLQGRYGEAIVSDYFNLTIHRVNSYAATEDPCCYFIINDINALTKSYMGRLNVSQANKNADGIVLTLEERNPHRGVDYMNELIAVYLKYGLTEKNKMSDNTVRFIDEQLEGIMDSLNIAGELFSQFRSRKGIVDLSQKATQVAEKLQELETERKMTERRMEYFKNLHTYMNNAEQMQLMAAPSVVGITDAGLNAQVVRLAELYSERSSLRFTVKEKNPALVMLNKEISNTLKSLEENIKNLLFNTQNEYENIDSQLRSINAELAGLPKTEQELINIKRSFDLNNELYTFLLQKRAEAAITRASNVPDANILDPARIETVQQTGPKRSINLMIGLVIGLAIPFIVIILSDYFNDTISSREDLEKISKLPITTEIAHNKYPKEIPVLEHPRSGIAETFRSLRMNLKYMANEAPAKVVSLHSMVSGEGKTFCSLNLAAILALDNKKVLLVGCDLRKPRLHTVFSTANDLGLSTYLIGQDTFEDILRPTQQDNLMFVNSGPIPPNPSELIGNGRFAVFIEQAKERFDYIILDNAPLSLVVDGFLIGEYADVNLLVLRQNYSLSKQVDYINQLKDKENFKHPGIILNDTLYHGYGNSYSYKSYKYYTEYGQGYYDDSYEPKGFWARVVRRIKG
jgi:capsular exopolysaccharide synthesis family protein